MNSELAAKQIIDIAHALTSETTPCKLLALFVEGSMGIANADAGTLYTIDEDNPTRLYFSVMRNRKLDLDEDCTNTRYLSLYDEEGSASQLVAAQTYISQKTINIVNTYNDNDGFDFSGTHAFDKQFNYRSESFLSIPLKSNSGEMIGVLQLINALDSNQNPTAFDSNTCYLVESIASMAATAMAKQQLLDSQKRLFESFVSLIAKAIDLKSPVTSKHCQNVPAIAIELANAVQEWQHGKLADVKWSKDELYELQVAAWLHDCGKLTTSELVMDKATKLQTQFDRIEQIKTRFQLYQCHLELQYYKQQHLYSEAHQREQKKRLHGELEWLQEECCFVEHCNMGSEYMNETDKQRVRELCNVFWQDSQGNTHQLVSEDEANFLCITRGTLSDEERSAMQGHMTATWEMLSALPYPKNLQNVPNIAGNHHEHLDGTGYPRGLAAHELSVRDRIMCIADIFEALTAPDRPYKAGMPLSQALTIMAQRVKANHLDGELFEVFIRSGTYKRYAEKHVAEHQRDSVDEQAILAACA